MSIFSKFSLVLLCFVGVASAQNADPILKTDTPIEPDPCLPDWIVPLQDLPAQDALTEVSGYNLSQPQADQYRLTGHTRLSQPGLVMLSDELFYDKTLQQAKAFGHVQLHQTGAILLGTRAEYDRQNQRGFMLDIQYQLRDSRAHGDATRIDLNQAERISDLHQASFTTCPLNDQAWKMHFADLQINDPKRRLYGYNTWLEFKGLPVFYTPYIDIPMDDRASGFLFPYIGSHKTAAQTQEEPLSVIAVPYYFNIAPNYDDTLTLVGIEERGVMLDNEFRYLQPTHSGAIQFSLLNDQLAQNEGLRYVDRNDEIQTDVPLSQRWRLSYSGNQNWGYGFNSQINWQEVSDPDFYNDIPLNFGYQQTRKGYTDPNATSTQTTSLLRNIKLNFRNGPIQAHIQHYGFLPLRNSPAYLEKHPEIAFNIGQNWGGLRTDLYLESTEFVPYKQFNDFLEDGYLTARIDDTAKRGQRTIAQPKLSYQINRPYGHLHAQVQANYRQYDLKNTDPLASTDNTVMQYALRGGLIFERDLALFGQNFIQTLEPEAQLLYVPYVEQSHLTQFDTTLASLDFSNIFSLNRFSGNDRIGDTKQLTLAVTNRVLDELGKPLADAAFGQIFFMQDRLITLGNDELQEEPTSDYFVKLGVYLEPFYFASTSQFDYETKKLNQMQNRIKIRAHDRVELLASHQALNLDADPALDETTSTLRRQQTLGGGVIINLNAEWQFSSYVNYDIQLEERREFLAGLRYDDCCWSAELYIDRVQRSEQRYNETLQFVIEFKGLSTFGNRLSDTIKQTLNF